MTMLRIGLGSMVIILAAGLIIGCGPFMHHGGYPTQDEDHHSVHQGCDQAPHHGQKTALSSVDLPEDEETKDSELS